MESNFINLQKDIFTILLKKLSFRDCIACSRTCKNWRRIITETDIKILVHNKIRILIFNQGGKKINKDYLNHNKLFFQTPWVNTKYIKPLTELEKIAWTNILGKFEKRDNPERFKCEDINDYKRAMQQLHKECKKNAEHIYKIDIKDNYDLDCIELRTHISIFSKLLNFDDKTIYIFLQGESDKTYVFKNKEKINGVKEDSIDIYDKIMESPNIKLILRRDNQSNYIYEHLHAFQLAI